MKKLLPILLLGVTAGLANASTIQIQTGAYMGPGSFASASDYKSAVHAAVTAPGATSALVPSYDNLPIALGYGIGDVALESNITFGVSTAGTWSFRAGVDFGKGGAIYLDGNAMDFKTNDMWWAGDYSDPTQYFSITSSLATGNHTLSLYGIEGCCSGNHQTQFQAAGSNTFVSFSNTDGLVAAVPEPETYAMMLAGLGLMAGVARRRKHTSV
jgi:hypothetical protein